jgi:hypothetical protein
MQERDTYKYLRFQQSQLIAHSQNKTRPHKNVHQSAHLNPHDDDDDDDNDYNNKNNLNLKSIHKSHSTGRLKTLLSLTI